MPARPLQVNRKDILKSKLALSTSIQTSQHGPLQSHSLLLDVPVESLIHVTSYLPPPSLFALSRANKYLYEHIKDDNIWHRAFVNQFLGIGPEQNLDNANLLLLRKQETTWRKEYIFRYNLRRRWERSRNATVTHSPQDSSINGAHLMSENGLLTSSIQYGVIARSLPLSGKILKGYLDASGTGLGIGNPNVEFTPNVSACALASDGGTARVFWGYRNGDVAVTTAGRVMDPSRSAAKLIWCRIEDQHEGAVEQIIVDNNTGSFVSAGADGRIKLWDSKTVRCLWSSEKKLNSLVPDPFVMVAGALSNGVIVGALKSGGILLWTAFNAISTDTTVDFTSIKEIYINSPYHMESKSSEHINVEPQFGSLCLAIDSPTQPSMLVSYKDHAYFYRLRHIDLKSESNEVTRFGHPSFGCITAIEPVLTQANESSFVITGDQMGFINIYEWNVPASSAPISPSRRFEAHEDGAVTAVAWNSIVLVSGSARGAVMVWDALTLESLRFFSSPMPRPTAGRSWQGITRILLEKELLVVVVGNKVMTWKVGQVTARDSASYKHKHSKAKRVYKGNQQYEMYKEINESQRELQHENAHRQQVFGRERDQRSTLDTLGLSELEAVEYVLMLSREEEERKRMIYPAEEGVFEDDIDDIHPSTSSFSESSPPSTATKALSSRRSSASSSYQQSGRQLSRVTVPTSNEKVQVTPPFKPEPMEAGASISPLATTRRLPVASPPGITRSISGSSDRFPTISSSLSSSVSPSSIPELSDYHFNTSVMSQPRTLIMSQITTPPTPISPGNTTPSGYGRPSVPGFSLLSADIARHAQSPNSTHESLDLSSGDMDDDLKFAIELSLAEARSRGDLV